MRVAGHLIRRTPRLEFYFVYAFPRPAQRHNYLRLCLNPRSQVSTFSLLSVDKHILIADDDLFLVKMYKLELEGAGYEVTTVTNGKLALEAIENQKPDLLLLDLLMPEVDGFTVLQQIQTKGYVFPVVVLSSSSQEIDKKNCKALGATDYIVKSDMELDQLAKMIKRYV